MYLMGGIYKLVFKKGKEKQTKQIYARNDYDAMEKARNIKLKNMWRLTEVYKVRNKL